MKTLGNIIWIVFGGLHIALEYFIAGLILMITITLRWRHLDMAHTHLLRSHILHHHHWHPIRKDAL